ncbi:MAG: glycosyltransferase family 2 protein [Sedimentisphaerales bacterium]
MTPLVGIVIVNWNNAADTNECLQSLAKASYSNYKIIIIDNGSENKQEARIKIQDPCIVLITNPDNVGFAVACNQGIEKLLELGADYVLLLNNDTTVAPDFLEHLIEYAAKNTNTVVSPKILYAGTPIIQNLGGRMFPLAGGTIHIGNGKPSENFKKPLSPDLLSGCAMLIPKNIIKKVGLMNPIYFAYYEDTDWCTRAKSAGYKLVVVPASVIWHKHSSSRGKNQEKKFYLLGRNSIIFARKNLHGLTKIIWVMSAVITAWLFMFALRYDFKTRLARLKGVKEGLTITFSNP